MPLFKTFVQIYLQLTAWASGFSIFFGGCKQPNLSTRTIPSIERAGINLTDAPEWKLWRKVTAFIRNSCKDTAQTYVNFTCAPLHISPHLCLQTYFKMAIFLNYEKKTLYLHAEK